MRVTVYCINKGTSSQYFGLMNADERTVIYYAPNNWRTFKGAVKWATNHGFEVVD